MTILKQEPPRWLKDIEKAYSNLKIDTKDPYFILKLELKGVNELIDGNRKLQLKYPKRKRGLLIILTRLKQMKAMLEEQIGENPELIK